MVVKFLISPGGTEGTVSLSTFGHFRDWLRELGAGTDPILPDVLKAWMELWIDLEGQDFRPRFIALSDRGAGHAILVKGVERIN